MMATLSKIGLFFKSLPWTVYAGFAALLLLGSTVWYCNRQVTERVEEAQETGQVIEQNKQLEETIKNVEVANEAEKEVLEPSPRGDDVRYRQCLRTARNPKNCERFLPNVQED